MKTYTEEFKKTIVELYEAGNKTKSELAREYGTSECNIRTWIKKYQKNLKNQKEDMVLLKSQKY